MPIAHLLQAMIVLPGACLTTSCTVSHLSLATMSYWSLNARAGAHRFLQQHHWRRCASTDALLGVQWLDSLLNFEKAAIPGGAAIATSSTWDLGTMHSLLRHMHNPHAVLQRVVHVVGTKGKGSAAVMLESVLQAAGYRVGRYSSPHMQCPGERISVDGVHLSWEGLDHLVCQHMPAMKDALTENPSTSYFEAFTALAIRHFADAKVDWAIMEAGLGGVKDATNVFRSHQVQATLITALECEHLVPLGGSIESIALAKAGIARPGGLVVVSTQPLLDGQTALESAMQKLGIGSGTWVQPQFLLAREMCCKGGNVWQMAAIGRELRTVLGDKDVSLQMIGKQQVQNAAAVCTVVRELKRVGSAVVSPAQARKGLASARLPGRFSLTLHTLGESGLPGSGIAGRWWLCMDNAHTALSCKSVVATLQAVFPRQPPIALVIGMAADKDLQSISRVLKDLTPHLVVCVGLEEESLSSRSLPAEDVASAFYTDGASIAGTEVSVAGSMIAARDIVHQWLRDEGVSANMVSANATDREQLASSSCQTALSASLLPVVCITGSNYIVGAAMEAFAVDGMYVGDG
eukprot:jgi/Ulvmu1/7585/UM038_0008.1